MALQDGEGFLRDYEAVGGKGVVTVVEFADEIRRWRWAKSDHFGTPSESCAVPKGILAVELRILWVLEVQHAIVMLRRQTVSW